MIPRNVAHRLATIMAAGFLALSPAAHSAPASDPAPPLLLGETREGPVTTEDLKRWLETSAAADTTTDSLRQTLTQPPEKLRETAAQYVAYREIARQYRAEHESLPDEVARDWTHQFSLHVMGVIRDRVRAEAAERARLEARDYYDQNQVRFRVPFSFHMRRLTLLGFVRYTAKEGDTLESIAEKISGDRRNVRHILTDAIGKNYRWVPEDKRNAFPFKPLEAGERLLVPMSPEGLTAVRQLLEEEILTRLNPDEGYDFERLCREFSESDDKGRVIGPLPYGATPMLPEIEQVARTLPINEISDVIVTRDGYQFEVIQVVSRVDETQIPFEEAQEDIVALLTETFSTERALKELREIWNHAEIDVDRTLDPQVPADAIVLTTERREWTRGEIVAPLGDRLKELRTRSDIIVALDPLKPLIDELMAIHAKKNGYFGDPLLADRPAMLEDIILAQWILKQEWIAEGEKITLEEQKELYRQRLPEITPPKRYSVRQIYTPLDLGEGAGDPRERARAEEKALGELREATRGVRSLMGFLDAVRKHSRDTRTAANGGQLGEITESYKPGKFAEVMAATPLHTPSEPFIYGSGAYVIWIDEVTQADPPSFESIQSNIIELLKAEADRRAYDRLTKAALERVGWRPADVSPAAGGAAES